MIIAWGGGGEEDPSLIPGLSYPLIYRYIWQVYAKKGTAHWPPILNEIFISSYQELKASLILQLLSYPVRRRSFIEREL
jgi:hypothetical protein